MAALQLDAPAYLRHGAFMSPYGEKARTVSLRAWFLFDKFVASLEASPPEDIASIEGAHPLAETVDTLMTPIVRLKCSFHGGCFTFG